MRAEWKEIKRGDIPATNSGYYASMNPKGHVVLNRWTYEMLGSPDAVNLLYDKPNNRIGLKPAALGRKNAYRMLASNRAGGKKVHAYRLIAEERIHLPHTVTFEPEIDGDGILVLDLRTAVHSTRAAGRAKRR